MKALVIGAAGKMGRAVVHHLANDPEVGEIGLLDLQEEVLDSMTQGDRTGNLKAHPLDSRNYGGIRRGGDDPCSEKHPLRYLSKYKKTVRKGYPYGNKY